MTIPVMRSGCGLLVLFGLARAAAGDVPRLIHYQGKLRETSGQLVNGAVAMQFRLYGHAADPTPLLFAETHPAVTVTNGLFNVLIGSRTTGGVPDSALNAANVYLGISLNGGTELSPRPKVVSTPHAIKSKSAEQLVKPGTFQAAAIVDSSGNVGVGTVAPAAKFEVFGDGAAVLLPRKTDGSDPAEGLDGMIYYNSATGKFRGRENGAWGDMRDGSGSANDPCNCPANPWTLVGVINSTIANNGWTSPDAVDISDNSKEYLTLGVFQYNAEFTINPGAPFTVGVTYGLEPNRLWYGCTIQDSTGVWRSGTAPYSSGDYPYVCIIKKGSTWNPGAGTGQIFTFQLWSSNLQALIFGDGTVRMSDNVSNYDMALLVFSRNP